MRIHRAPKVRNTIDNAALEAALELARRDPLAYQISQTYVFANGTTADATQVNTDLGTLFSFANGGIDHSNVNQSVGFYASDLKGSTTTANTFGGSGAYTFQNALNVNGSTIGLTSGYGYNVGTANVDTAYALTWGAANTVAPYHLAGIGSYSTTAINSVYGNVAIIHAIGSGSGVAIDQNGSMGITGGLYASGPVLSGGGGTANTGVLQVSALATYSPITGQSYGDGCFQRSASTGAIALGGASAAGFIDFGVTAAGAFTIATVFPLYTGAIVSAGLAARQGGVSATALATFSNPGFSSGDLAGQRSASTGAVFLGGASSYGYFDYGITQSGNFAASKPFYNLLSTASNGGSGAYLPPVMTTTGAALGIKTHIVIGQGTTATNGQFTVTLSGNAIFTSASSYFVCAAPAIQLASACWVTQASGSSFTVGMFDTESGSGNQNTPANWIAIGS